MRVGLRRASSPAGANLRACTKKRICHVDGEGSFAPVDSRRRDTSSLLWSLERLRQLEVQLEDIGDAGQDERAEGVVDRSAGRCSFSSRIHQSMKPMKVPTRKRTTVSSLKASSFLATWRRDSSARTRCSSRRCRLVPGQRAGLAAGDGLEQAPPGAEVTEQFQRPAECGVIGRAAVRVGRRASPGRRGSPSGGRPCPGSGRRTSNGRRRPGR